MQSKATTVKAYLAELPQERRSALEAVRKVIRENLPHGYKETMQYGMITYVVPLSVYPKGYLDKKDVPLPYVALAAQKNHMAIYLMHLYQDSKDATWFAKEYVHTGKKLDMGKSCVRFKKIEDLPLEVIGKAVALTPMEEFIGQYEKSRRTS